MRIECVIVSVNYSDFLEISLEKTKSFFDRTLIVTDHADIETKKLCDWMNVECLQTEAFYLNGAKFNKGNAIEAALQHLDFQEWCCHIDADIVLPARTGQILHNLKLNEQCIYGIDRMNCVGRDSWEAYNKLRLPQHELAYTHTGPYPLSTRICKMEKGGYIPIGFFQMFHRAASVLQSRPWYPTNNQDASTSDENFACKWDRAHRQMLPEIIGIHLEGEESKVMGANWNGRTTAKFELAEKKPIFGQYQRVVPKLN